MRGLTISDLTDILSLAGISAGKNSLGALSLHELMKKVLLNLTG